MERLLGSMESLDGHVRRIIDAASPTEVFRALVEASELAVPRASVWLLRSGRWKGMGGTGYPTETARRQRSVELPADAGWLASLRDERESACVPRPAGERDPDFGQHRAPHAVGAPIHLGGRVVAVLVAERHRDESPWDPTLLRLLVRVARLRLSLDLAVRRARITPPLAPEESAVPMPAVESGLQPWSARESPADRRAEEARRYARLVATDIRLYNEEAVMLGRRHGDLAARLGEQMTRGRDTFRRRFEDLGEEGMRVLEDAFVSVLAGGNADLLAERHDQPARR